MKPEIVPHVPSPGSRTPDTGRAVLRAAKLADNAALRADLIRLLASPIFSTILGVLACETLKKTEIGDDRLWGGLEGAIVGSLITAGISDPFLKAGVLAGAGLTGAALSADDPVTLRDKLIAVIGGPLPGLINRAIF